MTKYTETNVTVESARIIPDTEPIVVDRTQPYLLITTQDVQPDGSYSLNVKTKGFSADELGRVLRTLAVNY